MLCAGCARTAKDVPYREGVDLIWLEASQDFKAPVRGVFLSDQFFKHEIEKGCR